MSKLIKKIVVPEKKEKSPTEKDLELLKGTHHPPEITKDFLFGGKAVFVVTNDDTGEHVTYKVRGRMSELPKNSGNRVMTYFLNVKAVDVGSKDSRYAYQYVGLLNADDGTVRVTTKSDFKPETRAYKLGAWACQAIVNQQLIPNKYHINHAGKCGVCYQPMSGREAERGLHHACDGKMKGLSVSTEEQDIPF
jgi:hypothetical protein